MNVTRTINKYRAAWNDPDAPAWFLNYITCMSAIKNAHAELLLAFRAERDASRKLDMCRMAAMYLSGGYTLDVNLEVGPAYRPTNDVSLVGASDRGNLSSRFVASEPKVVPC